MAIAHGGSKEVPASTVPGGDTTEGAAFDFAEVIDGYKRIAALEQLGRDTAEAVIWPMGEAAAVLLDRSLRLSEHETALEVGWLLAELWSSASATGWMSWRAGSTAA